MNSNGASNLPMSCWLLLSEADIVSSFWGSLQGGLSPSPALTSLSTLAYLPA